MRCQVVVEEADRRLGIEEKYGRIPKDSEPGRKMANDRDGGSLATVNVVGVSATCERRRAGAAAENAVV